MAKARARPYEGLIEIQARLTPEEAEYLHTLLQHPPVVYAFVTEPAVCAAMRDALFTPLARVMDEDQRLSTG